MKTIYIDSDYKCHVQNDGTMQAVETEAFDRLCDAYIEGLRFIPLDNGEMIIPWKSSSELDEIQREYEKQLLAEYAEALKTLGVSL